jgi:hypothetical protein
VFDVKVKTEPERTYESVSKEIASTEIDAFVHESIARLREAHAPAGDPFSLYMGCDKDDAQLVEVCLPTAAGSKTLPGGDVAYTVARGSECDYPEILGAYDAVSTFVADSGRSFAGPPREIYRGEAELEIAFPLMP